MQGIEIDRSEVERLRPFIAQMDENILEDGTLRCMPHEYWAAFPPLAVVAWANKNGYYCIPTTELVAWLRDRISGRTAIEVASGSNGLHRHLGIRGTDSRVQMDPAIAMIYNMTGQKATNPPQDVMTMDANQAVRELKPQVVVAAWLTQHVTEEEAALGQNGSVFGAHEEEILDSVEEFILVGSARAHGRKRIMRRQHEEYFFPWVLSRTVDPPSNRIWTWKNERH